MSTASDVSQDYQSKFFPKLPAGLGWHPRQVAQARLVRELAEAEQRGYERGLDEAKRRFSNEAIHTPTMREIAEQVAAKHGFPSWKQLRSHRHDRPLVRAKQECWWRCREETPHSLPTIGRFFGFDHTTILHGTKMHDRLRRSVGLAT